APDRPRASQTSLGWATQVPSSLTASQASEASSHRSQQASLSRHAWYEGSAKVVSQPGTCAQAHWVSSQANPMPQVKGLPGTQGWAPLALHSQGSSATQASIPASYSSQAGHGAGTHTSTCSPESQVRV